MSGTMRDAISRPPRRPSRTSQSASQVAGDAPSFAQAHPSSVGSIASMGLEEDQNFQLATTLENAQWASTARESWEQADDDQRSEWWSGLSDTDRAVFEQYSGIQVEKSWADRLLKNPLKLGFHKVIDVLDFVTHQVQRTTRAHQVYQEDVQRHTGEEQPQVNQFDLLNPISMFQGARDLGAAALSSSRGGEDHPKFWRNITSYWRRANTNEGRYFSVDVADIQQRAGWDDETTSFLMDLGLKFGLNRMLLSDRNGINEALTSTLLEYVTEYGAEPEDAMEMEARIRSLLDDQGQFDLINELVGSRYSLGRSAARAMGLDPLSERRIRNRNAHDFVSGAVDIAPWMFDVTLIGGKVIKGLRVKRRGLNRGNSDVVDDMAEIMAGAQHGRVKDWAAHMTGGDLTEAMVRLTDEATEAGNATWRNFDRSTTRMIDTIQRALNDDLAYVARAQNEGVGAIPITETGGFLRDHIRSWRGLRNADGSQSALGRLVNRQGMEVVEETGAFGTAGLRKMNPVLSDMAVEMRRIIDAQDAQQGVMRVAGVQTADGITEQVARTYTREDLLRAFTDNQMTKHIMGGNFGGQYRHAPMLPGLSAFAQQTAGVKMALREGIDWLNDSNYRLVSRLVQGGRFGEYAAGGPASPEQMTEAARNALQSAGTAIRFRDVVRGTPGNLTDADLVEPVSRLLLASAASSQVLGKTLTFMTRLNPGMKVDITDNATSLAQINDFAAMLPSPVADRVTQMYASTTNLGQRVLVFRGIVQEVFQRTGMYDSDLGRRIADEYLGKVMHQDLTAAGVSARQADAMTGQIYSVSGLDRMQLPELSNMSAAVFPHQTSVNLALPDVKKIFAATRKQAFWSRVFGVDLFNREWAEKVVAGAWSPAVLARTGFPIRAGGEEALQFMLREGGIAYIRSAAGGRVLRKLERQAASPTTRHVRGLEKGETVTMPGRRGDNSMMWLVENLNKLRPLSEDSYQRALSRITDSNTVFASAWVGRMADAIKTNPGKYLEAGADWVTSAVAGKEIVAAAKRLMDASPEMRARFMGEASSRNFTSKKFREGQFSGGGGAMNAQATGSAGYEQELRELGIVFRDSGRFETVSQDAAEFYEHFRDQMVAPFRSPDELEQRMLDFVGDILKEHAPDGVFDGVRLSRMHEELHAQLRTLVQNDPFFDQKFKNLVVGSATRSGKRVVHNSEDILTTVNRDPDVLMWHGTRTTLDLDANKVQALQSDQGVSEQALRLVDQVNEARSHLRAFDTLTEDLQALTSESLFTDVARLTEFNTDLGDLQARMFSSHTDLAEDAITALGLEVPYVTGQTFTGEQLTDILQTMQRYAPEYGLAADQVRDAVLGKHLIEVLNDPRVMLGDTRLNALRGHPGIDFTRSPEEVIAQVRRVSDDVAERNAAMRTELDEASTQLLDEFGVDVNARVERGLTPAETDHLEQLRVQEHELRQAFRQFEEMNPDDLISEGLESAREQLWERLEEVTELVRTMEHRALRGTNQAMEAGDATNLRAIAMSNARDIDSRLGTGGMWYTPGTYGVKYGQDTPAAYAALARGTETAGAGRVYAFSYDGTWRPLNLDQRMPKDVFDATQDYFTQVLASMDPDALAYALSRTSEGASTFLSTFARTSRLPAAHQRALREVTELSEGGYVEYLRRLEAGEEIFVDTILREFKRFSEDVTGAQMGLRKADGTELDYWTDISQGLLDRYRALGYTGAEHLDHGDMVRVVWDPQRLVAKHEFRAEDLINRSETVASTDEALSEWSENFLDELLKRLSYQRDGEVTRLISPDIFDVLRGGEAPTLDKLRELNFARADGVFRGDAAAVHNRIDALEEFSAERLSREARDRGEEFVVDERWLEDWDRVRTYIDENSFRPSGGPLEMSGDDLDQVRRMLRERGAPEDSLDEIFKKAGVERFAEQTLKPMKVAEKQGMLDRIWDKPYSVIGAIIDNTSRDPMFIYNFTQGLRNTNAYFWNARPQMKALYDDITAIANPNYADDLLRRGRKKAKLTIEDAELPSSIASVNPTTGVVKIDRARLSEDYAGGMGYLRGEAPGGTQAAREAGDTLTVTQGSRQKAEVMARLGVDVDDFHRWVELHGGEETYRRFIIEHERAHVALGHKGVHEGDWLLESSIRQEVEATYVAFDKIGARHLTTKPYLDELTPASILEDLDDVLASYRRLQKGNRSIREGDLDTMLADHPAYAQFEDIMAKAQAAGFDPGEDSKFHFLRRVVERVKKEADDQTELAAQWAFNQTRPHIDSVAISSYSNSMTRNMIPFQWAAERFIKRAVMTTFHSPEALFRIHVTYTGMKNVGFVKTDEQGEDYFVYPATHLLYRGVGKTLAVLTGGGLRNPELQDANGEPLPDDLNMAQYTELRGRMRMALPGLDEVGRPRLGPFLAIPLRQVAFRFPSAAPMVEELIGPISMNPERPEWSLLVPSSLYNLTRIPNAAENMNHAMMQSFQVLAANDMLPADDDPGSWEVFHDRMEEHMKILAGMRVFWGFNGPAPAEVNFSGSEVQQELFKMIELYGFEDGYARWQAINPDATAWQIFGTVTEGGASIPATEGTFRFLEENEELAERYKLATAYLAPGPPRDGTHDEFHARAWQKQQAMGLRRRRDAKEMYEAIRYAEAAPLYFQERDYYQALREQLKGTPAAAALDQQWAQHQLNWQTMHPTFWNQLTSNDRQIQRRNIVNELRAVRDSGMAPENTESAATMQLLEGFETWQGMMNSLRGVQNAEAREMRRQLREQFAVWSWATVQDLNGAGESFYYRVVVPELSLDEATMTQIQQPATGVGA